MSRPTRDILDYLANPRLWVLLTMVNGIGASLPGLDVSSSADVCAGALVYPTDPSGEIKVHKDPDVYSIDTNSSRYIRGIPVQVTVRGKRPFQGFTLHARSYNTSLKRKASCGNFLSSGRTDRTYQCHVPDDTLVRSFSERQSSATTLWMPPKDHTGTVHFVANVVENKTSVYPNISAQGISRGFETIDLSGCGQTKGCFRYPAGDDLTCDENTCDYLVTYWREPPDAFFEMSALADWVAIGFSSDDKMGGDDVFMCVRQSTNGDVRYYRNNYGHETPTLQQSNPLNDPEVDITHVSSDKYRISCRFKRKISLGENNGIDLANDWFQLYSWGGVSRSGNLNRHFKIRPPTSARKVILSINYDVTGKASDLTSSPLHLLCSAAIVVTCLTGKVSPTLSIAS